MTILLLAAALPMPVLAQTGVVVQGRVFEAGGTSGIQNVVVELEGHGAVLTSADGSFRFERVEPGGYTLRIVAFGYGSESRFLAVDEDTTVAVPLEVAPLQLDPLAVELRAIEIEGRVRDSDRDVLLLNADVLTNQGRATRTDSHGRFRLEQILEDIPLRVRIQKFGYLPVDTILLPEEDESYLFALEPDPLVERMIDVQVLRIEERAAGRRAVMMRPMNRERLLRYAGHSTLRDVLESEYRNYLSRIKCVLVDEKLLPPSIDGPVLGTMLPEELERIEFLFRGAMLRIYTRDFIQDMIARDIELRRPSYIQVLGPPVCR